MSRLNHTNWRHDPAVQERLPVVARLRMQGVPNTRIAQQLGVSEGTIRNDLQRLDELWRERMADEVVTLRASLVADLEVVKRLAAEQYEFDRKATRAVLFGERFIDHDGQELRVHYDDKGGASYRGQPAASLGVIRQAVMDQAKILGVVVDKVATTDTQGKDLDLATILQRARENRAERALTDGSLND